LKMKYKMLGMCAPMSYVLNLNLLWVLHRWHDIRCLQVFVMVLWLELLS
jgi:hypothetical protein